MRFRREDHAGDTEVGAVGLLEFPEDLGAIARGTPASIWQHPELQEQSKHGLFRGALYQAEWPPDDFLKPTGLLSNAPSLNTDKHFYIGWPTFDGQRRYLGPLPDKKGSYPGPIGKNASGEFNTHPTAADHADMCMRLAGHLFQSWVDRQCRRTVFHTPGGGEAGSFDELSMGDMRTSSRILRSQQIRTAMLGAVRVRAVTS